MIPAPFRSLRLLRLLNVAAVGLALASGASAALGWALGDRSFWFTLSAAAPTWILGTAWAALLRWPQTWGKRRLRVGWIASIPFAMANAAAGAATAYGPWGPPRHLTALPAAILAATFGAILWLPALFVTLLAFGVPIARAQRLAREGLAGEERGEAVVGLACVSISAAGGLLALPPFRDAARMGLAGPLVCQTTGALGALLGASAAVLAVARERRRKRFVAQIEAGLIPGFRVDPTDAGKVLVRVVANGRGYRVADLEEEVFELDAAGDATRPALAMAHAGAVE